MIAIVEIWLNEVSAGTEVKLKWSGSSESIPMRILLPLMKRAIVRQTAREFNKFKDLVEKHGAEFSE